MSKGEISRPSVVVRPVVASDLADLVALCAEHACYEGSTFVSVDKVVQLSQALFTVPVRLHAWIAESAGQPVGYSTATAEFSTWQAREFLHMDCLYVRAQWRGAGIGAALLHAVIDHACRTGFAQIQWQTPDWNDNAQRFYRREGAEALTKQRFFLRVPS